MTREITSVLTQIVLPALDSMLVAGELDSLQVSHESGDGDTSPYVQLRLVVRGETFTDWVFGNVTDMTDEESVERLESDLQDFIAESAFAWGTLREPRR